MKSTNKFENQMSFIVPIIVIIALSVCHLNGNSIIKIVGDEYGYWSAGSYFAGLDWSELTSINSYYGFGYGIILSLLLRLPCSSITMYHMAIFLNGLFLCSIFCVVMRMMQDLKMLGYNIKIRSVVSFFITIVNGTLYYTQYTMCEVLLSVIYWILFYLGWRIWFNFSWKKCLWVLLLSSFMFSVHMRTIGIVFISYLFVIICICKNKCSLKKSIVMAFMCIFSLILVFITKKIYQSSYWVHASSSNASVNDIAMQMSNIMNLFTREGLINFLKLNVGYLFYSFSSTFLICGTVILKFGKSIREVFRNVKKKNYNKIEVLDVMTIYGVCGWFLTMFIAAVFLATSYNQRADIGLYGRYYEFTLGPIVFLGTRNILENMGKGIKITKEELVNIFLYLIITLFVIKWQNYTLSQSHFFLSTSGIYYWIKKNGYSNSGILLIALASVMLYVFIKIVRMIIHSNKSAFVIFVILSLIVIYRTNYTYETGCLSWADKQLEAQIKLANHIEEKNIANKLYYYYKDDVLKADILQFVLKDYKIHTVKELSEFIEKYSESYLLVPESTNKKELESQSFFEVYSTPTISLWKYGDYRSE